MLRKLLCPLFAVLFCMACTAAANDKTPPSVTVSVVVDAGTPGPAFSVNGEKLSSFAELGPRLEELIASHDHDSPAVVLCDERVPTGVLIDIRGLMHAIGFRAVHQFVFSKESGRMSELVFANAQAFSLQPKLQ